MEVQLKEYQEEKQKRWQTLRIFIRSKKKKETKEENVFFVFKQPSCANFSTGASDDCTHTFTHVYMSAAQQNVGLQKTSTMFFKPKHTY